MGELDNKAAKKKDDAPTTHEPSTSAADKTNKPADVKAPATVPDAHADLHTAPNAAAHADQKAVLELTSPTKATATMVDAGTLPNTKVVEKDKPAVTDQSVVSDKPLTPEEKYFTDLYQHRLLDPKILAKITPVPEPKQGESAQELEKRYESVIGERAKAIKQEIGRTDPSGHTWEVPPKFGPATQAAYKDYVDWIEKKEVPGQILAMQSGGLPFPPGNPIQVPIENGRRISLDDYDNRLATGKLQLDLGLDTSKPPTLANAQRLENALDWSNQTRNALSDASLKRFDDKMAETIKTLGLPEGWQYQSGQDKNAWRVSVAQMIDLTTSVGRMANLVDKLHLNDKVGLPPGAKVTTGATNSNISLDLPDNLRLNDPATAEKVRVLQEWEKNAKPQLDDALQKMQAVAKNPYLALAWGDTTIPKVKAPDGREVSAMVSLDKDGRMIGIVDPTNLKLDKDGKLLGTIDPNKPKPPGETFKEANLLEQRFSAKTDPKTGEIVVNQNVQGQEAPWWSYENMVYSNVGRPADLPERRFKPDELVAINKGSGTEFMLAKDLQAYAATATAFHYGEKVLTGVMDGAMLATGTIEIGAAIKGARILAAGAEAAAAITRMDVMRAAAKGTWDLTLGVTGVTSSAEIQSSSLGRQLSNARNVAFLGTIFYGAAASKIPALRLFDREGASAAEAAAGEIRPASFDGDAELSRTTQAPGRPITTESTRLVIGTNGDIIHTATANGTVRSFAYTAGADGKDVLTKIYSGTGENQMTLARSGDHEWTVHTPQGDTKLQADIKLNEDGSYTVSHLTDERAQWYKKAFYSEKPATPIVREVTYHPDGTVTTSGIDSSYKPPEGSTYRKDARFGEYWTEPGGSQVWIDGENTTWREQSKGIWRSDRGVLMENKEYIKKERTTAEELKGPLDWTRTEKVKDKATGEETIIEKQMHSQAGDMKIMDPNGKGFYVVERDVFDRTYQQVPGVENEFMKKPVRARVLTEEFNGVETRWGKQHGDPGDYLVTGTDGESYPVKKETFEKLYQRTTPDTDVSSFALPKATGPAVHNADGTTTIPHADGDMIWSRDGDTVTISNKSTGESSTYSGSDLHAAGTRFYFANGAEERITPGGLRFYRTPDMPEGEYRGEDGAVLRDVPRAEQSPLTGDSDPSPSKGSNRAMPKDLPLTAGTKAPEFTRVGDGLTAQWHVAGRHFTVKAYGTEWEEKDGSKYLIDSRSRIWQKSGENSWANDNGVFRADEQGQQWHWRDGSADWVDREGRQWHRDANTPDGRWTSPDGATYDEGSWQYTRRTKDDAHVPAVIQSLRTAALAQPAVLGVGNLARAASGTSTADAQVANSSAPPTPNPYGAGIAEQRAATPQDLMKGPGASSVEQLAHKLMLYSTYPVVGEQMLDILKQGRDIVGMQLQSMGRQLDQMWAPKNPYAVAHAVQDYDSLHPSARPDVSLPGVPTNSDSTCSWCPPGDEAKVVQEYKDEFARNLPDTWSGRASKEQITQLFDKLGHAVSAAGTPAEREALKKELAAKITFDRFQIEQLDQANQGALSDAQLHDLLDPDKRAALKNQQLKEIADEFATMKDSNVLAATSMALMILARTADQKGTISPAVADVDSYGHNAGYNDRGPSWVRPRTAHIQLDDALLTRNLQQTLPQMSADARGLAVGDLMVKTGTMKPQEFGSILQNVLTNPKSSAADKMNALSDAHGPRMAALVGGLIALQPPDAKGQAPGLATASGFGATVSDFMSTLSRVASTDSDRDVRTMAAGLMYGLKRFQKDAVMGSRLLDDLGELRQSDIDDKHGDFSNGDFSKHAQTLLNVEMSPIGPRAGTDRTLDAAESLSLLKTKLPAAEAAELQREIVRTLAGALKQSTPEQADRIAALITGDGMKQLSQTNPRLAEQTRTQFVSKLQLPPRYDATAESQLVSLVGKMVGIANGASDATKQQMFTALNNIAQNAPPVYMDLRSAAMEALGGLGSQSALPGLEKTAASDKFPALRLSALKALEQLKDPGLSELVSKRLGSSPEGGPRADASATESDATVLSYLRDLQYRLGGDRTTSVQYGDAASALMKFQTSINDRYTPLKSFNAAAQKDWTNEQFPLLVRANYDKEVVKQSDGKVSLWTGAPTDEGGDAVTAKRQEQFQQLAQVAQGNDQAAMQARKVLYSMITANGGTIGATEQIPTVIYVPNNGDSPYTQQAYYNEKPHDWATDAAVALAKTANAGFAGRDYTASLISQALASGVKGSAREQLLKAWETLGSTTGGVRTIPESLYQYVRSRAKE